MSERNVWLRTSGIFGFPEETRKERPNASAFHDFKAERFGQCHATQRHCQLKNAAIKAKYVTLPHALLAASALFPRGSLYACWLLRRSNLQCKNTILAQPTSSERCSNWTETPSSVRSVLLECKSDMSRENCFKENLFQNSADRPFSKELFVAALVNGHFHLIPTWGSICILGTNSNPNNKGNTKWLEVWKTGPHKAGRPTCAYCLWIWYI